MPAFIFSSENGNIDSGIIRADNEDQAKQFIDHEPLRLKEISDTNAPEMGVPAEPGYHKDALVKWIMGPADLFGSLLKK